MDYQEFDTNVELGKGGLRVKSNSGQVEFRNAGDSALVKVKALDGTADDDLVTKSQLDAVDTGDQVLYRTAALAFGTSSPLNIGATVTGTVAFRWQVNVKTAFDGTTPTLELGVSGDTDGVAPIAEIDLTAVGQYEGVCDLDVSSSTQIIGTYVADSSTAGSATIIVQAF